MAWGDEQRGELPFLFGALEGSMVAGVVPRELGGGQGGQKQVEEGVHPVRFLVRWVRPLTATRAVAAVAGGDYYREGGSL